MIFTHRSGSWDLSERARVVGILNVTPDSFSDGGRFVVTDQAVAHAEEMVEAGADCIDVGGQSTRPGAGEPVGAEAEWTRIGPVIGALAKRLRVPVSVDTYWGEVARRALEAGASMVNDVSGLSVDRAIADHAARAGAGLVIMHSVGAPSRFHEPREYGDVAVEVRDFLRARMEEAVARGVARERIALDPGIGFSKRAEQSVEAIRGLPLLTPLGRPLYIGVSRKSFLREWSGATPEGRVAAGLGATAAAYALGGRIFRTHDVKETREALGAIEAILAPDAVEAILAPEAVAARREILTRTVES